MVDHASVCRYATLDELHRHPIPGGEYRWLTPREQQVYARLRAGGRRATWLAGRILAKRLIADYAAANRLELPTVDRARVEIDSGPFGQRLAPRIRIADQPLPWSLSISHTQRGVLVALAGSPTVRVGVDLVEPAVLGDGFLDLWFTPAERAWLRRHPRVPWPSILWAAKEAVYKAVNRGEPFCPRQIEILPDAKSRLQCVSCMQQSSRRLELHMARTRQGEIAVVALEGSRFGIQGSGFGVQGSDYPRQAQGEARDEEPQILAITPAPTPVPCPLSPAHWPLNPEP